MDRASDRTVALVPIVVSPGERRSSSSYQLAKLGWLSQFSATTRETYEVKMRIWERWCTAHALDPLGATRAVIQTFGVDLEQRGLMPATRASYLCTLKSFYGWCEEEEVIDRNPASRVRLPTIEDHVQRPYLDRPEAARFLAAAQVTRIDLRLRDHALACILVLNGLRVSGLCDLNIETMNHERGHQTIVVTTKGSRIQTIPMAPMTYWALMAYIGERTHGPVFLGANGKRITRETVRHRVQAITRKAGINKRLSPHSCRRSFVTGALDAGVPLRDVQAAAMHKSAATTETYDQGRKSLDAHPTYVLGGHFSGG